MWESENTHWINEDEHTYVLYGVTDNKNDTHSLQFICRCSNPDETVEEIEDEGNCAYTQFIAYKIDTMRGFEFGPPPPPQLILNNVT